MEVKRGRNLNLDVYPIRILRQNNIVGQELKPKHSQVVFYITILKHGTRTQRCIGTEVMLVRVEAILGIIFG